MNEALEWLIAAAVVGVALYAIGNYVKDREPGRISNTAGSLLFVLSFVGGLGLGSERGIRNWFAHTFHLPEPIAFAIIVLATNVALLLLRASIVARFPYESGDPGGGRPN